MAFPLNLGLVLFNLKRNIFTAQVGGLESEGWNCGSGQGESGKGIESSTATEPGVCADMCLRNPECRAFDQTWKDNGAACRLYGENTPRHGNPGVDERQYCTVPSPVYGAWSDWTTCSATCGEGQRSRSRACLGYCHGQLDTSQSEACNVAACPPEYGPWDDWSACTEQRPFGNTMSDFLTWCGDDTRRIRGRQCLSNCGDGVELVTREEEPCDLEPCGADGECVPFKDETRFTGEFLERVCPANRQGVTDKTETARVCEGARDPATWDDPTPERKAFIERELKRSLVNMAYIGCDATCITGPTKTEDSVDRIQFVWRDDGCWVPAHPYDEECRRFYTTMRQMVDSFCPIE